ncbi:MAG: anaerobic ribonucleoside-triphosphate reductase activating protein [Clostridiales bacterium]|jgi:anaerobic ribonucleoside-triphosphate reductase activating protein|nr:anaerobic ribonucleoside-triphosphate reductase activating protein [Clostridiales bacterium]
METDSIVDGPGIRLAVFTQGCFRGCEGCHNPESHDPGGGYDITLDEIMQEIKANPLLDGVTYTGGEPLLQAGALYELSERIKEAKLDIAVYTGFSWEEALEREDCRKLLPLIDVMVDGRFELDLRSLDLNYKGSSNQRIIDVKSSLASGRVVLDESWR